ncbi:MAG: glycosyltransferase, partial [Myxococcales bacterium]|nr:glycosyltransferase [Myxococcales bacterium]
MSSTIAHLLTSFALGGGEQLAMLMCARQVAMGHRVLAIAIDRQGDEYLAPDFERAGALVRRVLKRPTGFDLRLPPRLLALFAAERVDVLHTHNALPQVYGTLPARLMGASVVHTEHGRHVVSPSLTKVRRASAQLARAFVAVSEPTRDHVRAIGIAPEAKLRVVLNGTEVERYARNESWRAEKRQAWGAGPATTVIGTAGRMEEVKNHALLLRALAPLLAQEDVLLVMAGDGDLRPATEALAGALGVAERVRFLGRVRDIPKVLSGLDVFAMSSHSEGLPMVLAEAMGASLPLVSTAVGGIPEVIDEGETGYLVPAGDEEALRDRLRTLARDPELRRRLGERGVVVAAERYSIGRMVDEYMA